MKIGKIKAVKQMSHGFFMFYKKTNLEATNYIVHLKPYIVHLTPYIVHLKSYITICRS